MGHDPGRAQSTAAPYAVALLASTVALAGGELSGLMHEAATHVARTLGIEYAAVWELPGDGRAASLRAAVCCRGGMVEDVTLDPDVLSDASLLIDDGANLPARNGVTLVKVIIRGPEGALGVVSAHATRPLDRLAGALLDVARITAGKLSLAIRPLVLGGTVSGALDALRVAAEAKGIALEEDLGAEPLQVLADPTRLQQVVWNLVGNAVKFTPLGGRVLVRLRRVHGRARLTITDTGRGISAAFLPHVFEPFRQAGGTQQGLGLGLAIVRELVELHGGTVCAESAGEGRGARFTVILPLAPAATEALGGGSMTACAS